MWNHKFRPADFFLFFALFPVVLSCICVVLFVCVSFWQLFRSAFCVFVNLTFRLGCFRIYQNDGRGTSGVSHPIALPGDFTVWRAKSCEKQPISGVFLPFFLTSAVHQFSFCMLFCAMCAPFHQSIFLPLCQERTTRFTGRPLLAYFFGEKWFFCRIACFTHFQCLFVSSRRAISLYSELSFIFRGFDKLFAGW